MIMAVENMILRLLDVGFLVALLSMTGAKVVRPGEYEFAPPEALGLAEDLRHHLKGEAISAKPTSVADTEVPNA